MHPEKTEGLSKNQQNLMVYQKNISNFTRLFSQFY